jgi:hypothetical protein
MAIHLATIVAHAHVTKPEALEAVALAVGSTVQDAHSSHPFVPLSDGGRVEIEVPKFGEAPPLAIDVYDIRDDAHATAAATSLLEALVASTGWNVVRAF